MRRLEQIKEDFKKQKEMTYIKNELMISGKVRQRYDVEEMVKW